MMSNSSYTNILSDNRHVFFYIANIYLVVFNVHSFFLEPSHISPIKVGLAAMSPIFFVLCGRVISKAFVWGILYWLACLFPALLLGNLRFSTIGYLGLFIASFIIFYTALYQGAYTLAAFLKVIRGLIVAYAICLLLQQVFWIIGIHHFPPINLIGGTWMKLEKLPSLSMEPSHTAVILSFAYLCYLRCLELKNERKPGIKQLFAGEEKWINIGFIWVMTTMGSGTAFLGLGVLSLYFINRKNLFYTLPFVVLLFVIAQNSEIKQLSRTTKIVKATMTGNSSKIAETDISGATRIVPLLNTFRMDFKQMNTWIGHGTLAKKNRFTNAWKNLGAHDDFVLGVVYQYGWIAFLIAIGLMFQCCIYRLLSLETLLWLTLGMATLSNVYTCWGTVMMMAGVRYFQEQKKNESLNNHSEL